MQRIRLTRMPGVMLAAAFFILCLAPAGEAAGPSAQSAVLACPVVVQNGGFEKLPLGANWTESGAAFELVTNQDPYRGSYSAELGGVINSDHSIKQTITLPKSRTARVQFWWEQATQENAPGTYADYLTVNLRKTDGSLLVQIDRLGVNPGDPIPPSWAKLSYDLSAYAGQTVQLEFVAHNDGSNPTWFYVDEVVVPACQTYLPVIRR